MTISTEPADRSLPAVPGALAPAVRIAIERARRTDGDRFVVDAAGLRWAGRSWSPDATAPDTGRPVVLLHGVTSWSGCWWRTGPALAAAGFRVFAPDLPGHGDTPPPPAASGGRPFAFSFADAAVLVAALLTALPLDGMAPAVVGHSWGALVAANLVGAGARVDRLVLLDPPVLDDAWARGRAGEVRSPGSRAEAVAYARLSIPAEAVDDVEEKADGLMHLDPETARAIFLGGTWDGGAAALAAPDGPLARRVPTWVIRADPAAGGYVADEALARFVDLLGSSRVHTIPGSVHSLERSHPRETVALLLEALGS